MGEKICQPGGIVDVGLATRHVPDIAWGDAGKPCARCSALLPQIGRLRA